MATDSKAYVVDTLKSFGFDDKKISVGILSFETQNIGKPYNVDQIVDIIFQDLAENEDKASTNANQAKCKDESSNNGNNNNKNKKNNNNNNNTNDPCKGLCIICWDFKATMAFIPCGHCCLCEKCAKLENEKKGSHECLVCRKEISSVIRIIDASIANDEVDSDNNNSNNNDNSNNNNSNNSSNNDNSNNSASISNTLFDLFNHIYAESCQCMMNGEYETACKLLIDGTSLEKYTTDLNMHPIMTESYLIICHCFQHTNDINRAVEFVEKISDEAYKLADVDLQVRISQTRQQLYREKRSLGKLRQVTQELKRIEKLVGAKKR